MYSSNSIFTMIFYPHKLHMMYILDYFVQSYIFQTPDIAVLEAYWDGVSTSHSLKLIW